MTPSVEDLRHQSERNRAELAATVDRLKQGLADTTQDLRKMVSPEHIKSEVAGYVGDKAQSWVDGLKQQAMDNPMRTAAAGAAVAVPLLRMARGVPLPLLMIAAGLALTSKSVRDRAADAAVPLKEKAGTWLDAAGEGVQSAKVEAQDRLGASQQQVAGAATDLKNAVSGTAGDLRQRAVEVAGTFGDKVSSGIDAVKDSAAAAPKQARQIVGDNAAVIGGLGIAIGAIIAAALPDTKLESQTIGQASDGLKRATGKAAQSGLEAAKDATLSAADAATKTVSDADLGGHAGRMTRNMADTLRQAAGGVVDAALGPSQNSNT